MAFPPKETYEHLIYSLPSRHPAILSSSLHIYTNSRTTCFVRGSIWFQSDLELRVFEFLDFSEATLLNYHYAVFRHGEAIRWYDPQPHPDDKALAATFPHHFHEHPEIKRNRRPAPGIHFDKPNLETLIRHCLELDNAFPAK